MDAELVVRCGVLLGQIAGNNEIDEVEVFTERIVLAPSGAVT